MASKWPVKALKDAGVELYDCDHRTPPDAGAGYPYIAIPQMKDGRIDLTGVRKITPEHWVEWTKRVRPRTGDVILSRRCNPGETAVVPNGLECALGQNLVILRSTGEQVRQEFLRWMVRGPAWWEQVERNINVGALFDSLTCKDIPNFQLPVPSIPEQLAIASTLDAFDNKLERNAAMNRTLEATARSLFKSWFVDLDPVRAKAEGRDTGLPDEVADLFPSKLVDSPLGEVPAGWDVQQVGEVVRVSGGSTPSTKEPAYWEGGSFHWATPKDLAPLQHPVLLDTERKLTDAGLETCTSGLLPKGTLLLSSRAPIGYLAISEVPVAVNQGFIAMVSERAPLSNHYMLHWCRANMEAIIARANGTTFLEISKANFRPMPILVPPKPVVQAFDAMAQPLHAQVVANVRESKTLAATRDAILPKLLSGELRVKELPA